MATPGRCWAFAPKPTARPTSRRSGSKSTVRCALRPDQYGGTDYTWLSGPGPGYGFSLSPTPNVSLDEHRENIHKLLADVDPATGYFSEDGQGGRFDVALSGPALDPGNSARPAGGAQCAATPGRAGTPAVLGLRGAAPGGLVGRVPDDPAPRRTRRTQKSGANWCPTLSGAAGCSVCGSR